MPTLSLARLTALIPSEVTSPSDPEFAELLHWLRRRDQFTALGDALEQKLIGLIGWPSIAVQLTSGFVTISDQADIRQLLASSALNQNDAERLSRRLDRRWKQWRSQMSETGLRGLRRREHAAAQHSVRLARRILLRPARNLQAIEIKIALLAAKAEGADPIVVQLHRDVIALSRQLTKLTNIDTETSRLRP